MFFSSEPTGGWAAIGWVSILRRVPPRIGVARHGGRRAGRWPVQLRFACEHTGEEYVSQQGWLSASLPRCPLHPQGGCGFARHGTYERKTPAGTRIARWYCPESHTTFSLLPDCLAARLTGTLAEVEAVVRAVEQAPSQEAACAQLRLEIELPGVERWIARRLASVHTALHLLKGLLPEVFGGCAPTLTAQVSSAAKKYSFQVSTSDRMNAATIPGSAIGRTIVRNAPQTDSDGVPALPVGEYAAWP